MEHRVMLRDGFPIANSERLTIIAGPCQLESADLCIEVATKMQRWCDSLGLGYVFKGSFDKANRTSKYSARGPGIEQGMRILSEVYSTVGCHTTTDIHEASQAKEVAPYVDIIQIPAMLSRQTDVIEAARDTGKVVNIKKQQGMAPEDMRFAALKAQLGEQGQVLLTERGTTFGYHNLVVDMRSLTIMKKETGWPVFIDASHSNQTPAGVGERSGGDRSMIEVIAKAAVASTPIAGVFFETHPAPEHAASDGATSVRLSEVPAMLARIQMVDAVSKGLVVPLRHRLTASGPLGYMGVKTSNPERTSP